MRFAEFEVVGRDDRDQPVRISSDGVRLQFAAQIGDFGQPHSRKEVEFEFPILGLTSFTLSLQEVKRGLKRQVVQTIEIAICLWDGPLQSTGLIEFSNSETSFAALGILRDEIWVLNYKWPLSSTREVAVRRLVRPGSVRHVSLLGPQGRPAFVSCLDGAPLELASAYNTGPESRPWPLGFEGTDEQGASLYLVVCSDRAYFVRPRADQVRQFLGSEITDIDLMLRRTEVGQFACVTVASEACGTDSFWYPVTHIDAIRHLYRFLITMWAWNRPYDVDDPVGTISSLESRHNAGHLDTITFAALVTAIARRSVGEQPALTYPLAEDPYVQVPASSANGPKGSGISPARAVKTAAAAGIAAGAVTRLFSE